MRRASRLLCFFTLISPLRAQTPADLTAIPAAAQSAFKQGADFEQRQQLTSAVDSYKSAVKQSPDCVPCFEAIIRVQMKMETFKDAAATAAKLAAISPDAATKAHAETLAGQAFYRESFAYSKGEGAFDKNPKRATDSLKQAEAALARGLADDPSSVSIRMLHAHILAALHRDEDANREFVACSTAPNATSAECARALNLAKDIASARSEPAPSFTVSTLDGKQVTLDSLAGKTVLIDFWATWCTYCRRDSDYVQSMLDSFPADRFVLLEVDVDESRDKWVSYVKENRLEGVQARDDKKQLQNAFDVGGYPTYIVLDGNGAIRFRTAGAQGDLRGTIRDILAEHPEDAPAHTKLATPGQ